MVIISIYCCRFIKYEKMKKMLPEGPVRQKMTADGISAADIDAFFDGTLVRSAGATVLTAPVLNKKAAAPVVKKLEAPEGMALKPELHPHVKLKSLFWNKLPVAEIKG